MFAHRWQVLRLTVTAYLADRNQFMSSMQRLPRIGVSATIFSAPAAAWLVVPLFGTIISVSEVAVVLAVVFTALYGSDRHSSRAFQLLWLSFGRPSGQARQQPVRGKAAGPGPRGRQGRS